MADRHLRIYVVVTLDGGGYFDYHIADNKEHCRQMARELEATGIYQSVGCTFRILSKKKELELWDAYLAEKTLKNFCKTY